jgi:hypothetical protein
MLNRHSKTFGIVATTLLLGDLATLAVLFSRLGTYSTEFKNVIPLTQSTIDVSNAYASSEEIPEVWFANTSADIFKYSYDDGITVQNDGEKLIYPGTSNEYTFTLENPSEYLLDYELTMVAYITGTDYVLPVDVNVSDYTGKYLVGGEDSKVNVMELNGVDEKSKLSAGRFAVYTLNWEWAYESGNDEYDTMLGNLATDEDITLTIEIHLTSNVDEDDELWRSRFGNQYAGNTSEEISVEVSKDDDEDDNNQGKVSPNGDANSNQNVNVVISDINNNMQLPENSTTSQPIENDNSNATTQIPSNVTSVDTTANADNNNNNGNGNGNSSESQDQSQNENKNQYQDNTSTTETSAQAQDTNTTTPKNETGTETSKTPTQTTETYGMNGYTPPNTGDSFGGVALATAITTALAFLTKPKRKHHKEDDI